MKHTRNAHRLAIGLAMGLACFSLWPQAPAPACLSDAQRKALEASGPASAARAYRELARSWTPSGGVSTHHAAQVELLFLNAGRQLQIGNDPSQAHAVMKECVAATAPFKFGQSCREALEDLTDLLGAQGDPSRQVKPFAEIDLGAGARAVERRVMMPILRREIAPNMTDQEFYEWRWNVLANGARLIPPPRLPEPPPYRCPQ